MPNDHFPTVAIPDLNSNIRRFHLAINHAPPRNHHLILLGDVIDHGYDTPQLLEEIRDIHARHSLQFLAGYLISVPRKLGELLL